jgi:hypothetical protein
MMTSDNSSNHNCWKHCRILSLPSNLSLGDCNLIHCNHPRTAQLQSQGHTASLTSQRLAVKESATVRNARSMCKTPSSSWQLSFSVSITLFSEQ